MQLAAGHLAGHLAADWKLAELVDVPALARRHAVLTDADLEPLAGLVEAAEHLAALERRLGGITVEPLVGHLYPSHHAPVAALLSRAELACAGGGGVSGDAVDQVRAGADRLLRRVDDVFREGGGGDFGGCLRIWEVGDAVVAPLLDAYGRVAVLLVDAMRADLAARVIPLLGEALPAGQSTGGGPSCPPPPARPRRWLRCAWAGPSRRARPPRPARPGPLDVGAVKGGRVSLACAGRLATAHPSDDHAAGERTLNTLGTGSCAPLRSLLVPKRCLPHRL